MHLLLTMFPELLTARSDALLKAQIYKRRLGTFSDYPSTKEVDHHHHQAEGFGGTSPFHKKSSQTRFTS